MCFRCVLEQIYCKFTVCILFDIFFQKVSDIFKKETYHFPFTKHKPIISFPVLFPLWSSRGSGSCRCGLPGVVPPVWPPKDGMTRSGETTNARARVGGSSSTSSKARIPVSVPGTSMGNHNGLSPRSVLKHALVRFQLIATTLKKDSMSKLCEHCHEMRE